MFRNAVCESAPRKPPEPSTVRRNRSNAGSLTTGTGVKCGEARLPLPQGQGLRAARGVDSDLAQARPRLSTRHVRDPRQRAADLLAPKLKHRLDEAEEPVEVSDDDGGSLKDVHGHERRVDAPPGLEGRGG